MRQIIKRREFLSRAAMTASAVGIGSSAPGVFCQAAQRARNKQRILVVVELAGGNDGLNCVVPHSNPVYLANRKNLRIAKADVLPINNEFGFHPSLRGFADLLEQNQLGIVQAVGYPNPNRSHFESMDIWHTCLRKDAVRNDGWIGRYLESQDLSKVVDPAALHLGTDKQPFALMSRGVRVPSIRTLAEFRLRDNKSVDFAKTMQELSDQPANEQNRGDENELLGFIQSSTKSAIDASVRMKMASGDSRMAERFSKSGLGQKLSTVAQLIAANVETRVFYVRLDGFDTHAHQPDAHAALLREVSESVSEFVDSMRDSGDIDRVLVMCFSEFGRRVAENASSGTDHGTAGPVFLAGGGVRAGLIGEAARLTDLENGDLKFKIDFRSVYATVLREWLNSPVKPVLGDEFDSIDLFA